MSGDIFISIDAGTSVVKSVAFDSDGKQIALASASNNYRKIPGGGVEQNLARTWQKSVTTLAAVVARVPNAIRRIAAIAVTGQGDGTWLIDRHGVPVGGGLLWLDTRAAGIVSEFETLGIRQAAYQFTGCGLNACNQSAQLVWLKRNQPERLEKANCAMHCKDWLYFNLTGERVTDISEGIFTFGDFRTRKYAPDILDAFDLVDCKRLLPPMIDGCQVTHPLSMAVAKTVGLPAGTPVSLGGVDVVCTALGGGVYAPDSEVGCSIIGSTGMHIRMFNDAKQMPLAKEPSGYTMVLPGFRTAVLRMHSNMSATLNLDWFAGFVSESAALLGVKASKKKCLEALNLAATESSSSGVFYLPYIESGERGPFLNADARAQFIGLHGGVSLGALARAVYESLAFAARHCYEALGDVPREIRLIGGGARAPVLREAFANILGARIRTNSGDWQEPGAIGAAMMASVAVGLFPDIREVCRVWVDPNLETAQTSDTSVRKRHDEMFAAYLLAVESAEPVWDMLAKMRAAKTLSD